MLLCYGETFVFQNILWYFGLKNQLPETELSKPRTQMNAFGFLIYFIRRDLPKTI